MVGQTDVSILSSIHCEVKKNVKRALLHSNCLKSLYEWQSRMFEIFITSDEGGYWQNVNAEKMKKSG